MRITDYRNHSPWWGLYSLWQGLQLSWKHFFRASYRRRTATDITQPGYFQQPAGAVTLRYPHEQLPVPERGRYKLHNEIDDCILCDKCAKVCPVDCIEIVSIKSPTPLGKTSNGMTKRLHAAQFDIDLAKCCFCGLCTTVCPTECLTMTPEYDYSVFDLAEHKASFATMSPEEAAQHRQVLAQSQGRSLSS